MPIIAAYGIPGLTCVEVALMLSGLPVNYGIVRQSSFRKVMSDQRDQSREQPVFPVIFSLGSALLRTQGRFKTAKVVALVVDNPITLTRNLNLPLIGSEVTKVSTTFSPVTQDTLKSILRESTNKEEPLVFTDHKYKPVDEILKQFEQSDLSKIQTFLYKIKDVETRDRVSNLVKQWLLTPSAFSKIESRLQRELNPRVVDTLKVMLGQPSVADLRQAIRQVRQEKMTPSVASKRFKVSAFDLRFLLATRGTK